MRNPAADALRARIDELECEVAALDELWTADRTRVRVLSRVASERLTLRNRQLRDLRRENGELRVARWKAEKETEVCVLAYQYSIS